MQPFLKLHHHRAPEKLACQNIFYYRFITLSLDFMLSLFNRR